MIMLTRSWRENDDDVENYNGANGHDDADVDCQWCC